MDKGRAHHGESQSPVQSQFSLLLCVWETPHCGQGGWLPGPRVSSQTPDTGQGKSVASLTSPVQGCLRLKKSFFFFYDNHFLPLADGASIPYTWAGPALGPVMPPAPPPTLPMAYILLPRTCELILFGKAVFAHVIQALEMRSAWITRVGPKSNDLSSEETEEEEPGGNRGRD